MSRIWTERGNGNKCPKFVNETVDVFILRVQMYLACLHVTQVVSVFQWYFPEKVLSDMLDEPKKHF